MIGMAEVKPLHCVIVASTVTVLCDMKADCNPSAGTGIQSIAVNVTSLSGTLTTTNIIMANWSRSMWQSVVNRAIRMLASRPFGSHFLTATASVS
ncbi:hypothetical protein KIN20_032290 [Parelaphostrongylus tenuis]|uniref:Uncharacterized protein n=1 Tax=Parelaphostrongylus tenuis TaxID=148309 RepID=A0AAD5R6U5_PARTN|nr:hypothetical protein KIN20_032290 [Parelaphostrongylus tenuis]